MKENVLSFSLEFLLRFNKLNNQSNINKLRVLIDGANIKINNKVKENIDVNRLMDPSNQKTISEKSAKGFYPRTDEQNLRYYLFWHEAEDPDLYMEQNGIAMTDVKGFLKFYRKFCIGNQIYFSNNNEDNHISSWYDSIIKYLFTTKKMIIYDPYLMKKIGKIENNLIPLLQNIQCSHSDKKKTVFVITYKDNNIAHYRNCFNEIKKKVSGLNLIILASLRKEFGIDRFILTDYFNINANHSLQACHENNVGEDSELDFKILLDISELKNYQNKIERIKKIFLEFDFNRYRINQTYHKYSEIHSNISNISRKKILKILDTF